MLLLQDEVLWKEHLLVEVWPLQVPITCTELGLRTVASLCP
jgi:hypothetical protein